MCADTEGRTPERETRHDICVRIAPLAVAVTLLEDMVCEEVQGEHLASVRMTRQVEVYTIFLALSNSIGLVIQHYSKTLCLALCKQRVELCATQVLPIVTTDNAHTIYGVCNAINKKVYSRSVKIVTTRLYATYILMVTSRSICATTVST